MFKNIIGLFILLFLVSCNSTTNQDVNWLTWDKWEVAAKKKDRKGLIWIHSPSCDDCLRMKDVTFKDPVIIDYLNKHFYTIMLDKDEKQIIKTKGREFHYVKDLLGESYHQLAAALSPSPDQISIPTFVFLDENFETIVPIPKALEPSELELLLHFIHEDAFKKMNVEQFKETFKPMIK